MGKRRQQDLTARVSQRLPHRYSSLYSLLDPIMKYPSLFQSRNSKVVFFCVFSLTTLTNRMISKKTTGFGSKEVVWIVEYILKSIFSLMFLFLIKRLFLSQSERMWFCFFVCLAYDFLRFSHQHPGVALIWLYYRLLFQKIGVWFFFHIHFLHFFTWHTLPLMVWYLLIYLVLFSSTFLPSKTIIQLY